MREKKTNKEKVVLVGELHQNGDFITLSGLREREKARKERERVHLEEHEIARVCRSTALDGDTSSDSAFLGKASPTRELRGIHKREGGQVRRESWAEESCQVRDRALGINHLMIMAQIRSRNFLSAALQLDIVSAVETESSIDPISVYFSSVPYALLSEAWLNVNGSIRHQSSPRSVTQFLTRFRPPYRQSHYNPSSQRCLISAHSKNQPYILLLCPQWRRSVFWLKESTLHTLVPTSSLPAPGA